MHLLCSAVAAADQAGRRLWTADALQPAGASAQLLYPHSAVCLGRQPTTMRCIRNTWASAFQCIPGTRALEYIPHAVCSSSSHCPRFSRFCTEIPSSSRRIPHRKTCCRGGVARCGDWRQRRTSSRSAGASRTAAGAAQTHATWPPSTAATWTPQIGRGVFQLLLVLRIALSSCLAPRIMPQIAVLLQTIVDRQAASFGPRLRRNASGA